MAVASAWVGCSDSGGRCLPRPPYIEQCREVDFCRVAVSWRVNEDYDWSVAVDAYDVYRRIEGGELVHVYAGSYAAHTFSEDGLDPETTYYYSVTATNHCGASKRSAEAGVTTSPLEPSNGRTLRVPDVGSIQQALDLAAPGDTVLVACGRYGPLEDGLLFPTYGIALISETGTAECSILDFQGSDRGITAPYPDWIRIEGFTITGVTNSYWGGGIKLQASPWKKCWISDCRIEGNTAGSGGGVAAVGCSATISHCVITDNSATSEGGGVMVHGGTVLFEDCTILGNHNDVCPDGMVTSTCTLVGCEADTTLWCNHGTIIIE
jgi:hypothetical protein